METRSEAAMLKQNKYEKRYSSNKLQVCSF